MPVLRERCLAAKRVSNPDARRSATPQAMGAPSCSPSICAMMTRRTLGQGHQDGPCGSPIYLPNLLTFPSIS